ncbi:TPA: hypothetical protein EYP38_02140, partial [Candidatus Micrarchaeota archaeon]|nr:hypothetical protein [Candidatus Micrarchaeota archaeon]
MRIVFISGVEFGLRCLEPIVGNGTDIAAIFSLDGREDRSGYVDFSGFGEKHGIPVHKLKEFKELNSSENVKKIKELNPDLVLVIGWSGLIGEDILAIPPKGTLGHHPTMLPKHRGNAPIPWTLINGLSRSGVTLFYLEKEMDTGDIAGQREFEITLDDDASTVYAKAIDATAQLLLDVLP